MNKENESNTGTKKKKGVKPAYFDMLLENNTRHDIIGTPQGKLALSVRSPDNAAIIDRHSRASK